MKRVILASLFALLITGGIAIGYFYYQQLKSPSSDAIIAVPTDAAFVIETRDAKSGWENLKKSSIWQDLLKSGFFTKITRNATFLDSVFNSSGSLSRLYENQTVFVSAHVT